MGEPEQNKKEHVSLGIFPKLASKFANQRKLPYCETSSCGLLYPDQSCSPEPCHWGLCPGLSIDQ